MLVEVAIVGVGEDLRAVILSIAVIINPIEHYQDCAAAKDVVGYLRVKMVKHAYLVGSGFIDGTTEAVAFVVTNVFYRNYASKIFIYAEMRGNVFRVVPLEEVILQEVTLGV